jgi:carbonic anhydrase/acetyltransferase-like protein (isoleucine patch superfamily)
VTVGRAAILGPLSVMRGDGHVVKAGGHLYLGHRSTVHISHELYGATLGEHVTVGNNSVVHACTVADDCVIEDDVTVLDGAAVGAGTVVAAGSVVLSRAELPAAHWCEGSPAVAVRPLRPGELQAARERIRKGWLGHQPTAPVGFTTLPQVAGRQDGYVAATVTVTGGGALHMEEHSSLWFGCVLELGRLGVVIASGANVQDNTVLRSAERQVRIGEGSTIGHNVLLHDCAVGARTLVGMSSTLAPGTVVMDDTFVAAASCTEPGQVLETGWLWAGRPARPVSRMKDRWKTLIRFSADSYREYAVEFGAYQRVVLRAQGD